MAGGGDPAWGPAGLTRELWAETSRVCSASGEASQLQMQSQWVSLRKTEERASDREVFPGVLETIKSEPALLLSSRQSAAPPGPDTCAGGQPDPAPCSSP